MKKTILALFALSLLALPVRADINDDFRDHFNLDGLTAYNRDLATLMGQADFHTGKAVTFPGFDIGANVTAVKTSSENFSEEKYFYAPFITAETQLPILNLGIAARGTTYNGFKSIGGGVKWTQAIAIVNLSASVFYDRYGTDYYEGDHYSASASASASLLIFTPYIGVGYDYSSLKLKDMGTLTGKKSDDDVLRYTAGVNIHPLPFLYVYGAYTYSKYNQGFQGGLGLNF